MRLDLPLYGMAIVLFITTAVTLFLVGEQDGRFLYGISTAAVGLISVIGGYFVKPKMVTAQSDQPSAPPNLTTLEQSPPAIIEAPIVEVKTAETEIANEMRTTTLVLAAQDIVDLANVIVQDQPKTEISQLTFPEKKSELLQIRGINQNRADQLKVQGINTIKELAGASSLDLAAKLQVSPKIVKMWIGSAKKLSK
jgi:predicted flap endonuclease-1-like 5' DNA nuclease